MLNEIEKINKILDSRINNSAILRRYLNERSDKFLPTVRCRLHSILKTVCRNMKKDTGREMVPQPLVEQAKFFKVFYVGRLSQNCVKSWTAQQIRATYLLGFVLNIEADENGLKVKLYCDAFNFNTSILTEMINKFNNSSGLSATNLLNRVHLMNYVLGWNEHIKTKKWCRLIVDEKCYKGETYY